MVGVDVAFARREPPLKVARQLIVDRFDEVAGSAIELAQERFGIARQGMRQLRSGLGLRLGVAANGGLGQDIARAARAWRRFGLDGARSCCGFGLGIARPRRGF
jgi:hypothetical protein